MINFQSNVFEVVGFTLLIIQILLNILLCEEIDWPMEFSFISPVSWIENMKKSPLFYYLLEYIRKEKQSAYENLLLTLSSNVLRRKIVFISIFEDMETHSSEFEPADDLKSKTVYYIAGARKYFFLSIFKQNL